MDKSHLDKFEGMIANLITMVGNVNNRLDKMDGRLDKMDERLDKMDERLNKMEARMDNLQEGQNSLRKEIMDKLIAIQVDQDHIWEKTVKNEREIAILKGQLQR